jgi:hypothetical protein
LTTSSLTTLSFNLGTGSGTIFNGSELIFSGSSSSTTINPGTLLSFTGSTTVGVDYQLIGDTSSGAVVNSITLSNFTLPTAPAGQAYSLSTINNFIDLVVASTGPASYTWSGTNSNIWDTSTSNWNSGAAAYSDGSNVTFDDSAGSSHAAVTLTTTVSPGSITVNNTAVNYAISGTGGKIVDATSFTKSGTGTVTIGTALTAGSMTISAGTVKLASGVAGVGKPATTSNINLSSLSITGTGVLDVYNNHVIITYTSSDPMSTIYTYLQAGYASGAWNGTGGIDTSAPLTVSGLKYGIGFADGNDAIVPGSGGLTYGQKYVGLTSGQIEIAYTLVGDANLDGIVNGTDLAILAANFNQPVTAWDQGNFHYGAVVNGTDLGLMAANFNQTDSGASSAGDLAALDAFAAANGTTLPGSTSSVPEPATTGLLTLGALGVLARRRRH